MDKRFLDKVVEQIVSESRVDYEEERIYVPFTSPFYFPLFRTITDPPRLRRSTPIFIPSHFTNHCKSIYTLKDVQEIEYVWGKYGDIINKMLKSKDNINESTGMDKKFLDKVVDQLVSETRLDYEKVYFPFSPPSPSFVIRNLSFLSSPPPSFSSHCKEVYGLNEKEIEYVWKEYREIIKDKIKSKDNINESTGMNYKFLNKVVDQIVSETMISKRKSITEIRTPFSQKTFKSFDFSKVKKQYSDVSVLFFYFNLHCEDVYSLDDAEITYVFSKYRNIIILKINGIIESYNKKQ